MFWMWKVKLYFSEIYKEHTMKEKIPFICVISIELT